MRKSIFRFVSVCVSDLFLCFFLGVSTCLDFVYVSSSHKILQLEVFEEISLIFFVVVVVGVVVFLQIQQLLVVVLPFPTVALLLLLLCFFCFRGF